MPDDQQVDWTLSEAPAAADWPDEAPTRRPPEARLPPRRRALPRRAWLVLAALPVLALLFTWLYGQVETARLRRDVTAVVDNQEQARLDGDWDRLRGTFADDPMGWANQRISLLRSGTGGLPMPIELPGYWFARQAGQVTQFQMEGAQRARADVTRVYETQTGARVTLSLPQFYQFTDGAWRQTAAPDASADQALSLHGVYVDVDYFPADAALAASLRDNLDALLATACADWDCPADLRVPVRFETGDTFTRSYNLSPDIFLDSWTLQVIAARGARNIVREVTLPTALEGGYAADAAAVAAVQRVAGITALMRAAQRVAPDRMRHGDNAYMDALVTLEAARLGLDGFELLQAQYANPLFTTQELWSLGQDDYINASAGAQGLVIVNHLLADRLLRDQRNLLHALEAASAPDAWLAAGLGLPLPEARASLAAAAAFNAPPPRAKMPGFTPALALNCANGPLLADLEGQTAPLFAAGLPGAQVRAWSPGGERLAVSIAGRLGMVDLAGGESAWPPQPALPYGSPILWASERVLAYPAATRDTSTDPPQIVTAAIGLWDAGSGQYLAPLAGQYDYVRSPDGAWAALEGNPYGSSGTLSIVPALGGNAIFTAANAQSPAWSSDSRQLAFTQPEASGLQIVILDRVTGRTRTVLAADDPRLPPIPANGYIQLSATWSPAGDRLLIAYSYGAGGWAGLLSSDGRDFKILPAPALRGVPYPRDFSADGQFVSVSVYGEQRTTTAIYSAADGQLLQRIPDQWPSDWSPAGHTLALTGAAGASLLREPGNPAAAPERVGPAGCIEVVWRPALASAPH